MKAFTQDRYGGPEVLTLNELPRPTVKEGHVLVKVVANSANPADWHTMRGTPFPARLAFGIFKPKNPTLGGDFAGIIKEVPYEMEHLQPGDMVYGEALEVGTFAEYIVVPASQLAKIPQGTSCQQMAGIPIAGLTAIQALVTHGLVKPGESILINGAAGGVGHFCVQIAKALGAEVTAVSSSKNVTFITSLGAKHTIAYDEVDIHQHPKKYDLVLDVHGNLTFRDFKRMGKRGVKVGFTSMANMASCILLAGANRYPLGQFTAKPNTKDLQTLATMVQEGLIKTHIEKIFPYEQIPEAIGYIESMHTRGKVIMVWEEETI